MTATVARVSIADLNAAERNGVGVARTPGGIAVGLTGWADSTPLTIEVEVPRDGGKYVRRYHLLPSELPFRDYYGHKVDHLSVGVRVKRADKVLVDLPSPLHPAPALPYMRLVGEQRHVTENYVSVPPALTITDEVGAVWTLGFEAAPADQSPGGEFAFNVLRDGIDTGIIASRIERRSGKIRAFTRHGWKRWLGREWS
jgi:hypothetical protein